MKPKRNLLLAASIIFAASPIAFAADVTWDNDPGTVGVGNGTITGGAGTWNTTTGNWTKDAGANNIAWDNLANDKAIFGGTGGTVALGTGITANGLTFNSSGYSVTGDTLTLAGTTPGVNVATGVSASVSSILVGTAGLTKTGDGTLILSSGSANTYTGGTTVSAGTLQFSALNNLQGATSIASGATVNFVSSLTGTTTLANTFTGAGTLKLTLNAASGDTILSGVSGMTGTVRVTTTGTTGNKWSAGGVSAASLKAVVENNAQLYIGSGTTTLSTVNLTGTGNTENRGALRLGGTLNAAVTLDGNTTIGSEGGTLNGNLAMGGFTLTTGTSNSTGNLTFLGTSITGGGTINVTQGQLRLTRSSTAINLGSTNINLGVNRGMVVGSVGSGITGGTITMDDGSLLSFQNGGANHVTSTTNIVLASGSGSALAASIGGFIYGNNTNLKSTISGSGDLRWRTGILSGGSNSATLTADNNTSGWAVNSYTGATSFEGVNLTFALASNTNNDVINPFGASANTMTQTGGQLRFLTTGSAGNTSIIENDINFNVATGNTATFYREDGNLRLDGDINITTAGTGKVVLQSKWGSATGKGLVLNGILSGSGALTVSRVSGEEGAVHLANNGNTYNGTITVDSTGGVAGILVLDANGAATSAKINLAASGSHLNVNASNATIAELSGIAGSQISSRSAGQKLTVNQATNTTFAGVIGGVGITGANAGLALVKDGAGTLTLTGTNTYTGTTDINGGTLLVNGSHTGTGLVTVKGTLGGTGSLAANVTIASGGTLAPGASIESLGTGNVSFANGSTFAYELDTSSLNGDLLDVTGSLSLGGTATLSLTDLGLNVGLANDSKLTLISYTGAWNNGIFNGYADDSTFTLGANQWKINYNDTTGGSNFSADQSGATSFVTMTVVPEPGAALLGGLGALFLLRRRRNG